MILCRVKMYTLNVPKIIKEREKNYKKLKLKNSENLFGFKIVSSIFEFKFIWIINRNKASYKPLINI